MTVLKTPKHKSVALVAASGTGKTTLSVELKKELPKILVPISCTTRPIGPGEVPNINYYYITVDNFELRIQNNEFLEWNIFDGNYYGTLYAEIDRIIQGDEPGIFDVDINGAVAIKRYLKEKIVTVFLEADRPTREARLRKRGREKTEADLIKRLDIGDEEIKRKNECDEVIPYGENAIIGLTINKIVNLMLVKELASG